MSEAYLLLFDKYSSLEAGSDDSDDEYVLGSAGYFTYLPDLTRYMYLIFLYFIFFAQST